MLNFLKHLTWACLTIAAASMVLAYSSDRAQAEPLPLDTLKPKEEKKEEIPEINEAWQLFQKGNVKGAKDILDKVIPEHPELMPAEMFLAQFFAWTRQPKGIRPALQQAVLAHPEDPRAYIELGKLDARVGQIIEAWLLFHKAQALLDADTKIAPEQKKDLELAIKGQLAQLSMARKDWKQAKEHLGQVLKEQPENAFALQYLAGVFFEEGNTKEALQKLQEAKKVNEEALTPQATLALWYEKKGEREKSIEAMTEALKIAPKDLNTRLQAGSWALRMEDFDNAKTQAEAALKLDPESVNALFLAGNVAIFQHDYPTAEKYLEKATQLEPLNFPANNNLALALCEQDDPAKIKRALSLAKRNAKTYEESAEWASDAFSTLGRTLYKSGDIKNADLALRKSASLGPSISPDTAYYLAVVLADQNKNEDAKKVLQQALQMKGLFTERKAAEVLLKRLSQ